jgi:hypothetical protein
VSLSLLKVDIRLGSVAMDVVLPYRTALGGIRSGYLSPGFSWWDGLFGVGRFSEVVLCEFLLTGQAWELELNIMVHCFSLNSVSFRSLPVFPRWWNVLLFSAQQPPPTHTLDRGEIFLLFICLPILFRRGAIYPQVLLDCVVPSRADDVLHLSGRIAVSLGWIRGHLQDGSGSSLRFCVHELWWIQDDPDACRTLPREDKRSKNK